jgi:hypothetical protein
MDWNMMNRIFDGYEFIANMWLEPEDKKEHMARLESAKCNGELDHGVYSSLKRLNALPGLVSCYSCIGHKDDEDCPGGYFMVRATRDMGDILDNFVIEDLGATGLVYSVEKEWQYIWWPEIRYVFRFKTGKFKKVVDKLIELIIMEI